MNSSTETKVPKIRFPEFDGKWENRKLSGFITSLTSGISVNSYDTPAKSDKIGVLKTSCVSYGKFYPSENKEISDIDLDRARLNPKKDTILISRMNTPDLVGEIGYVGSDYQNLFLPDRLWMTKTTPDISVRWLSYQLVSPRQRFNIKSIGTGTSGSMKNISKPNFLGLIIYYPPLLEQQKIASFLSQVDRKIDLLQQKVSALETYKKGVMQQLFSQQLRFKQDDGNDFPDWGKVFLGDIGEFRTSSVDKKSKIDQQKAFLINYMDVYNHLDINNKSVKEFQIVTAKQSQIASSGIKKGDILFTPSSETPSDIGHSVVVFEDIVDAVFSYHLLRFRPKIKLDLMYSHYFCNIPKVLMQISKFATGSTRFTISSKNFSKIKVDLPSQKEQTKIANFLSSIDQKIAHTQEQLEQTQSFKKGLLQKMFV